MSVTHPKGGKCFGLVSRIISLRKRSNTMLLDYVGLIINYLKKRRVGDLRVIRQVSLFEASNSDVDMGSDKAYGKNE